MSVKSWLPIVGTIVLVALGIFVFIAFNYNLTIGYVQGASQNASVFHVPSFTGQSLQDKYTQARAGKGQKVKILIMPGHEPTFGGAEYGQLKERVIAVDLAQALHTHLNADSAREVNVA